MWYASNFKLNQQLQMASLGSPQIQEQQSVKNNQQPYRSVTYVPEVAQLSIH
jgi:hypothetical protein